MSVSATGDMQVNTFGLGSQAFPRSILLDSGGWVTIWQSNGQDGSDSGLYMQAFAADGAKLGSETLVNTTTMGPQTQPDISLTANGAWVVTWTSYDNDGTGANIYQQRFELDAMMNIAKLGSEEQVNSTKASEQQSPQVEQLPSGGWVVIWQSFDQDGSGYGIVQQVYNPDGTKASGELMSGETLVNQWTMGNQDNAKITVLSNGKWVVTWDSDGEDGSGTGVCQQLFDTNGMREGMPVPVNTDMAGDQHLASTLALPNGEWIVLYSSSSTSGSQYNDVRFQKFDSTGVAVSTEVSFGDGVNPSYYLGAPQITLLADNSWVITSTKYFTGSGAQVSEIIQRHYDADGTQIGDETVVNTYSAFYQDTPQIMALTDGGWVVTWQSNSPDPYGDIFQQAFHADGSPHGGEVRVNTYTDSAQGETQIVALADGGWVTTWQSGGQDFNGIGVFQKVFHFGENIAPEGGFQTTYTVNEDKLQSLPASFFSFSDANGDLLQSIEITEISGGAIGYKGDQLSGNISWAANDPYQLYFIPDANLNGGGVASISYIVKDNGGLDDGGSDTSTMPSTITFNILPVNDAPSGTDSTLHVTKGSTHQFAAADFGYSDTVEGNNFAKVIVTIPGNSAVGTFSFDGNALAANTAMTIDIADIGKLVWTTSGTASLQSTADLIFKVVDDGGTANDGKDTDQSANYLQLKVFSGSNTAPFIYHAISDKAAAVGNPFNFVVPSDTFKDDTDSIDSLTLAAFDADTGMALSGWLSFNPAVKIFSGNPGSNDMPVNVKLTATDSHGATVSDYFTVGITGVNFAPMGSDMEIEVAEDKIHKIAIEDFGFFDPDDNELASVFIENISGKGKLQLDGVSVTSGQEILVTELDQLTYISAKNGFGKDYGSFTFRVKDDGGSDNNGVDTDPTANKMTFNVTDEADHFFGTNGNNKLIGTNGHDYFNAKAGNDTLVGKGGKDWFIFKTGCDRDTIRDFQAQGSANDIIDLEEVRSIKNYADLMADHIRQSGSDVVIDALHGDKIKLKNVDLDDLGKADFYF